MAAADANPDLLYDAARVILRQLAERRGLKAIENTLIAAGNSPPIPFARAFGDQFGEPVEQVDADLLALASGSFAVRFPDGVSAMAGSVPATAPLQFVFVGLEPNHRVGWVFQGPGDCAKRALSGADGLGVAALTFALDETEQASCIGHWSLEAASRGGGPQGQVDFTVTAP